MCIEKIILISILSILLVLEAFVTSNADTAPAEKLETVAVVLVIDTSGSMRMTDPKNLRGTAANIFIDLLSPEDYLGIITFNTSVDVTLPIEKAEGSENKINFKKTLSPKLVPSGDTNYQLALSEAKKQLDGLNDKDIRKVIVFLTDGEPDPDPRKENDIVFMNKYMDSLWGMVSEISFKEYPIYSIGFSEDINPQILQKISSDTRGKYQGINDSAELASIFFQILSDLKNRNNFLNTELSANKEKKLEFEFDQFTSQVTLVYTYSEDNPIEVRLLPPSEKMDGSKVSINKTSKYTIITLNQNREELVGKWKVNINGNGTVKALGAKDLFLKTWLNQPLNNSIHSVNNPIKIEAAITGPQKKDLHVEAQIKKNGIEDAFPVILKYNNGMYKGVYEETDETGTYDIAVRVFRGNKLINDSTSKVFVKVIPTLETDFYIESKSFLLGNSTVMTSWLNVNGNVLKPSNDLRIEKYQIVFHYADGNEEIVSLHDNGNPKNGDILPVDGIFSSKIKYSVEGQTEAVLIAEGVYKDENFILEKPLGTYHVYPPGMLSINIDTENLYGKKGDVIKIPLSIKNTSAFTELINLSAAKPFGTFMVEQISADPGVITENTVSFKLNKNLQEGVNVIPVSITAEEPLTKLKVNQIDMKIQVVSGFEWILKKILGQLYYLIALFFIPLFMVLTGLMLYRIFVYPKTIVHGILCIYESGDVTKTVKELKLNSYKKSNVVISLNGDKKNTYDQLLNSRYTYNIIFTNIFEKGKWKFIEGYKALGRHRKSSRLQLRTTEPGIFQCKGNVYTKKELCHGDLFESGGYIFEYLENKKIIEQESSKDLLEGKI